MNAANILSRGTKNFAVALISIFLMIGCNTGGKKKLGTDQTSSIGNSSAPTGSGASIHEAALGGDLAQVSLLLDSGAKADTLDLDRRTALMYAAYNGNTNIMKVLISRGASVNLRDINGRTALMMASSGPFQYAVKFLLENYADPDLTDSTDHYSALMYAASEGQLEVVRILLAGNANPFLKDVDGDDALAFARRNNHGDVASLLQKFMDKNRKK
jgi:ankyrin repeat protein